MRSGMIVAAERAGRATRAEWVDPRLIAAAVALGLAAATIALWGLFATGVGFDARLVAEAGRRFLDGAAIYTDPTARSFEGLSPHYYGPPALLLPYLPLALAPDPVVNRIGFFGAYAAAAAAVVLLLASVRGRIGRVQVAATAVGLAWSYAFLASAHLGNPSILVLVCAALAFFGLERRSLLLAGFAVGTAAAFRLYPAVLVPVLLLAGRTREAVVAVAVAVGWTVVGAAVLGVDATRTYLDVARLIASPPSPEALPINASIAAWLVQLGAPAFVVPIVRTWSIALGLLWLALAVRMLRSADASERLVGWGTALAGMLLLPATTWDHYYTALLVLVVGLVAWTGRARWGLASVALVPGTMGVGLVAVALPAVALLAARPRRSETSALGEAPA